MSRLFFTPIGPGSARKTSAGVVLSLSKGLFCKPACFQAACLLRLYTLRVRTRRDAHLHCKVRSAAQVSRETFGGTVSNITYFT